MSKVAVPEAPKRPKNAYFMFKDEVYQDVKKKNPDLKITELTKVIAGMYEKLDEGKKKEYKSVYEKEMEKFKAKMAKYNDSYGHLVVKKSKKKKQKKPAKDSEDESDESVVMKLPKKKSGTTDKVKNGKKKTKSTEIVRIDKKTTDKKTNGEANGRKPNKKK